MVNFDEHPLLKKISDKNASFTPKNMVLKDYILKNTGKVLFMTIRELSAASGVSEATIVRFVGQVGFDGYSDFQQTLRDMVDTDLPLSDRIDLTIDDEPEAVRFRREIQKDMENLKLLHDKVDIKTILLATDMLYECRGVYVVGSRFSFTMAYYMGWAMTKIRGDVSILKGSDSTCLDHLAFSSPDSVAVIVAASRYPNELLRLAKHARRIDRKLIVISDSAMCPLNGFADLSLVAPSKHISVFGSPASMISLIGVLLMELAHRYGNRYLKDYHNDLEKTYRENDILFNLETPPGHFDFMDENS